MTEDKIQKLSFIPPCHIWNELPSGAIQEITGSFDYSGIWHPIEEKCFVYLPYSKTKVIRRVVDRIFGININWSLVFGDILKLWEDNGIASSELEYYEIVPLLVKVGVLAQIADGFEIVEKYRMVYERPQVNEIIDITDTVIKE